MKTIANSTSTKAPKTVVAIRLDPTHIADLRLLATWRGLSVSQIVNEFVLRGLQDERFPWHLPDQLELIKELLFELQQFRHLRQLANDKQTQATSPAPEESQKYAEPNPWKEFKTKETQVKKQGPAAAIQ